MFHRWTLVRTEQTTETRDVGGWDDVNIRKVNVTLLYYVCGRKSCHETKILVKDGHWTLEELLTSDT